MAMRPIVLTLLVLSLALAWSSRARAEDPPSLDAFDRTITAELVAKNPEAATVFAAANAARERGDLSAAAAGYTRVLALVPEFVHAKRRLCSVESRRGNRGRAITLCREALAAKDSPENHGALALALVTSKDDLPSNVRLEAMDHAKLAVAAKPDDMHTQGILCEVAIATGDVATLRSCSARLVQLAPNESSTHIFVAIVAASDGRKDDARAALGRARLAGMPQAEHDRLLDRMEDAWTPPLVSMAYTGLKALGGWLGGFAVLLVAGWFLSRAALRSAERVPSEPGGHVRGTDAKLRKTYRVVLWICCAYYYASLPIVAVATLLFGGGAIVALLAIGHVPIKLFAIIIVVAFATIGAIVRSVVVRGKDVDPGVRLDLHEHPKLDAALVEVAGRIGTRRVDNVYLTPGTEIAVTERGGMFRQLRRKSERALILGAGVLSGMTVRQLKAILAHEYGHFHNEDTAGGGFSFAVRRSLMVMAISLARGGAAGWFNPAWWFVRGFYNVFLRISHGASRLQEVLADRWAAFAYGSDSFEGGLRHVIAASVAFSAHADATLEEVVNEKRALTNLYAYAPAKAPDAEDVRKNIAKEIEAEPSPYDSHPAPRDRIAWVRKIAAEGAPVAADDGDDAWSLLADRAGLERSMTKAVRDDIFDAHGVRIPCET